MDCDRHTTRYLALCISTIWNIQVYTPGRASIRLGAFAGRHLQTTR